MCWLERQYIVLGISIIPVKPGKHHAAGQLLSKEGNNASSQGLPFYLKDYLQLVEWTGRVSVRPSLH